MRNGIPRRRLKPDFGSRLAVWAIPKHVGAFRLACGNKMGFRVWNMVHAGAQLAEITHMVSCKILNTSCVAPSRAWCCLIIVSWHQATTKELLSVYFPSAQNAGLPCPFGSSRWLPTDSCEIGIVVYESKGDLCCHCIICPCLGDVARVENPSFHGWSV